MEKKAQSCPSCGKARTTEHAPFCSKRCQEIDLHRWLSGSYVAAGEDFSASPEAFDENRPVTE